MSARPAPEVPSRTFELLVPASSASWQCRLRFCLSTCSSNCEGRSLMYWKVARRAASAISAPSPASTPVKAACTPVRSASTPVRSVRRRPRPPL
eukprot:1180405-Prorocentrum_minimum.AAC.4